MNLYGREDFERLSKIKGENCISIFLPVHSSGIEVNEGLDKIAFKNKLQEIRNELEKRGITSIDSILQKPMALLNDSAFWRNQETSLALFFSSSTFDIFKLPISVSEYTSISNQFELSPLLPLLSNEDETFYILSLNQKNIKLFKNTPYSSKEISIGGVASENIDEIMEYFDFDKQQQVKSTNFNSMMSPSAQIENSGQAMHSTNPKDKETRYLTDFLKQIDKGLSEILKDDNSPLVLAGTENVCGLFREITSLRNIQPNIIPGNIDRFHSKELLEEGLKVVGNKINKTRKKAFDKYPVWAGTGKASYDLETILVAAYGGRVESLFVSEDYHIWGNFNEKTGKVIMHSKKEDKDVCLIDLAVSKTLENNGNAYLVNKDEMPEKTIETSIAATFRY